MWFATCPSLQMRHFFRVRIKAKMSQTKNVMLAATMMMMIDDSLQEMELAPETNLEFVLNHLNEEVIKLNPPPPPRNEKPTIPPPIVVKVRKPPHCLKCGHAKLGHDRLSSTSVGVPFAHLKYVQRHCPKHHVLVPGIYQIVEIQDCKCVSICNIKRK